MLKNMLLTIILCLTLTPVMYAADNPSPKQPGDRIDDFTLKGIDGSSYTLSDMKSSKAVVVIFWSTECPFVQPYRDRVINMYNDYSKQGIAIWAVNANNTESLADVQEHAKKNDYPFPMLKDVNNVLADQLGATRTPEVFVIDPNSNVVLYHGRIDDSREADKVTTSDLKNALDDILAGKDIAVKTTKQFGCTIKRVEK